MSRLLEKLTSASKSQPLGFGAAVARAKSPPMVLIANLRGDVGMAAIAAEQADAVLISMGDLAGRVENLRQDSLALGSVPWGVSLETVTKEEVAQLLEMGCDFLVFGAQGMPSAVLGEEGIGKVLEVDPSLTDSLVRTIDRLPIDAVLIGMEGHPITVYWLMVCQRFASLVRKPLIAAVPAGLLPGDLEGVWDAGARGVLVEMEEGGLLEVRKAIDALPTVGKKRREKTDAILPLPGEVEMPLEEEELP